MSSGSSSTAGSNAYSSDMVEADFLKRNRVLHVARLGLSFALLAGSIAVIACEAIPYNHYKSTVKWASVGLDLWPPNLDIRPSIAAIACGCVIAALNLIYFVVAVLPSPYSRIQLLNGYSSASAIAGFITALVGILFSIYLPSSTYPTGYTRNETLQSWTCKWSSYDGDTTAPSHFSRDCHDSRAGFALLYVLLALEICMGFGALAGAWFQKSVGRRREEQLQLEKLEIATKQAYRA
ncbi:hypothetical protein N7468_007681 [Penicillium chermesinum]|uniref:Uncharacterized protein n=1 Tax=Penicillium chermesinum TaxID=63820 RepID=A0A9W9NUH9_9EURO|nr:uncharacterized protein N7468_007681 [Penicillium chermesinum]KAJ5226456.1 hypothetical protein N7468_007681 [Penicillium chermesinum]KAJ6160362.1 hypothetical protein N7470_003758 [Penicillium chermesinum]